MNAAFATEMGDLRLIPSRVKPKTIKIGSLFTASLFDVRQLKGQSETFSMSGRQMAAQYVDRWQLCRQRSRISFLRRP